MSIEGLFCTNYIYMPFFKGILASMMMSWVPPSLLHFSQGKVISGNLHIALKLVSFMQKMLAVHKKIQPGWGLKANWTSLYWHRFAGITN